MLIGGIQSFLHLTLHLCKDMRFIAYIESLYINLWNIFFKEKAE